MNMTTPFRLFDTDDAMTKALLEETNTILRGPSPQTLLLSGGGSPCAFYSALGQEDLPWGEINLALVDERWVDEDDAGSNAALVKRTLMASVAGRARFTPMKTSAVTPHEAAADVDRSYRALPRPTLCILGMGPDTHTASWFSDAAEYDTVSRIENTQLVAGLCAPQTSVTGNYLQRMTITAAMLNRCDNAFLIIKGDSKIALLETTLSEPAMASPIGRATALLGARLKVFALRGDG